MRQPWNAPKATPSSETAPKVTEKTKRSGTRDSWNTDAEHVRMINAKRARRRWIALSARRRWLQRM